MLCCEILRTYSQCIPKKRTQKGECEEFTINSSVRQEDALAPLLYIIFIDKCSRDIRIGLLGEETLMYADFVAVLMDTRTNRYTGKMQTGGEIE